MTKPNSQKPMQYWILPALVLTSVVAIIGLLIVFPPKWEWLGIGKSNEISQVTIEALDPNGKKTVTTTKYEQAKTLWDWLGVLGVPLSLALLAWWLQHLQEAIADKQEKLEKEIAEANQREEALQDYFDRISTLLIDKNLLAISAKLEYKSEEEVQEEKELLSAAIDIIQAITLSIFRRLGDDYERKTDLLGFLFESEIINKLKLNLSNANLSNTKFSPLCDLSNINFSNSNLSNAFLWDAKLNWACLANSNLSKAFLMSAQLNNADLWHVNLSYANLLEAKLLEADLRDSNLTGAILERANFSSANLSNANLSNANLIGTVFIGTELKEARLDNAILLATNFRDVKELSEEKLQGEHSPLLCNVNLPKGMQVNPNRDCESLPKILLEKYPEDFETLDNAQFFVDELKTIQWD
jgi:uncharacterized protein YjbI with pentapeptide repeats